MGNLAEIPANIRARGWAPSYKDPKGKTTVLQTAWIPECPTCYITPQSEAIANGWARKKQLFKSMGITSRAEDLTARDELAFLALSAEDAHVNSIEQIEG